MRHRYPHIRMGLCDAASEEQMAALVAIPGIRHRKQGYFIVPHHAMGIAADLVDSLGLSVAYARWAVEAEEARPWEDWRGHLSGGGEMRPFVLEGFLTEYQEQAVAMRGHLVGAHFWHSTGAGKTLTAILWALLRQGPVVIVTRAASRLQQAREVERFTHLRPFVIRPKGRKGGKTVEEYLAEDIDRHIVILAWESLVSNISMLEALRPGTVVFDESHRGKSPKRWQAVPLPEPGEMEPHEQILFYAQQEREAKSLGGFIPEEDSARHGIDMGRTMIVPVPNISTAASRLSKAAQRVCATTATPIKDRVRDLWAQLDLVEPFAWGSASCWMQRYADARPNPFGGMDTRGSSNLDELADRLEGITHRVDYRDTHRHLPKKRRQSVYIAPEDQCRPSAGFPAELRAAAKRGATAILEVRIAQSASRKERAVLGLVEDHVSSGHKLCIFTGRRRDVDRMGETIGKQALIKKKGVKVWAAHGGASPIVRQQVVDDYMAHPGPCILVGTGDAFGESLNLQDTDAALFVQLPYTPGALRQWEGRFCRLGQKRPVVIYYVIAEDTVDEHVADILISKLGAVERVSKDTELAEAEEVLGGMENEEEIMDSILSKMEE